MSRLAFNATGMSPVRRRTPGSPASQKLVRAAAMDAGERVRRARLARRWTLEEVERRSGLARSTIAAIEAGANGSLDAYARLAATFGQRVSLLFSDADARRPRQDRDDAEDFVHAAMGEVEARVLGQHRNAVAIDEPYQHYQFAGRADVVAWNSRTRDLLHIENRTRFPNLQEAAGAYNAKRQYLAPALAHRLGVGPEGWRSVAHIMACLWSSEVLHVLRLRPATFAAICPDGPGAIEAWVHGEPPPEGVTSALVLLDPSVPFGSRRRTIAAVADLGRLEPRVRSYREAAALLRRQGS